MPSIFDAIWDDQLTRYCVLFIALCFTIAFTLLVINTIFRKAYLPNYVAAAPSLLTTLGVLGTFVGIFFGLMDFDVSNIDASVPRLLSGMKTAFATSIVGMGTAILLKVILACIPSNETAAEVTPEAIYSALVDIRDDARRNAGIEQQTLHEVRRAISSDGDASLLTQIQKMRTDFQDGQKELIAEFRSFTEAMAENSSKALIEALNEVIRNFNAKINEQFGENFKELNAAVGALLTWQDNYRFHVEQLEQRLEVAVATSERSGVAMEAIAGSTAAIPAAMADLEPILRGLDAQIDNLGGHLEAVAALREKALSAFPIVQDNITRITSNFAEAAESLVLGTRQAIELQGDSFRNLRDGYAQLQTQVATAQDSFQAQLDKTMQALERNVGKSIENHYELVEHSSREIQKQISEAWTKTESAINKQMATLDEQMQNVLHRTLSVMGQKLASLSEKFVSDYTPLTERLREVVRVAARV